jgi:hypothetical protein
VVFASAKHERCMAWNGIPDNNVWAGLVAVPVPIAFMSPEPSLNEWAVELA